MIDNMIERVAMAICDRQGRHQWADLKKYAKEPGQVIAVAAYQQLISDARAAIEAIGASGYRIVKDVETGEASRPGFDKRSYEVGYMEGENSVRADLSLTD